MRFYVSTAIAFMFLAIGTVTGQDKQVTAEPYFWGAVRPVPEHLPLPEYPDSAQKARVGGRVSVGVTVDPSGSVTAVGDVTGPYPVCSSVNDENVFALRSASVNAAKIATFKPLTGETLPIAGRLNYVFGVPALPVNANKTGAQVSGTAGDKEGAAEGNKDNVRSENAGLAAVHGADGNIGVVSGGVLNGKAAVLPKPGYPPAARAVRAEGAVSIQVLILENGTVYTAQAVSGHPLLRAASEVAACGASFSPTLLSGRPVKVSGVITYVYKP